MTIEFLDESAPRRGEIIAHIRAVYDQRFGAEPRRMAPVLVASRNAEGQILCAAGLRLDRDGFFSDAYLDGGFDGAIRHGDGRPVAPEEVMEVTTLASVTPFPVLGMLDAVIGWGLARGKSCGVFTATSELRQLLARAGLGYSALCPADPARLPDSQAWGRYYEHDPWVCACTDIAVARVPLSPRGRVRPAPLANIANIALRTEAS